MRQLLDQWLGGIGLGGIEPFLAAMPSALAVPTAAIALAAIIVAVASRHGRSLAETLFLAALALVLIRFSELPAVLMAVGALVNAAGASRRRALDLRLRAIDGRIDTIQSSLDGFLGALDRRSREVDGRSAAKERLELETTGAPVQAPVPAKPNGADTAATLPSGPNRLG